MSTPSVSPAAPSQSRHGATRQAMPPTTQHGGGESGADQEAPPGDAGLGVPVPARDARQHRPAASRGQTSRSRRMSSRVPSTSPIVAHARPRPRPGSHRTRRWRTIVPSGTRRERSDVSEIDAAAQDVTPEMAAVAAAVGAPDFVAALARPLLRRGRRGAHPRRGAAAGRRAGDGRRRRSRPRRLRRGAARARRPPRGPRRRRGRRARAGGLPRAPRDLGHVRGLEGRAARRPPASSPTGTSTHYAEKIRADVEAVRDGHPGDSYEARYSYVLLDEAEAIVAAQDHIYLWPCDCRSIVGKCRKPKDVCLRFENDRGLGWEISQGARRRDPARHRQGRPHAHGRPPGRRRAHLVDLQLLHRLLLPAPRGRASGRGRRVAGAPLRRPHRHGPLQEPAAAAGCAAPSRPSCAARTAGRSSTPPSAAAAGCAPPAAARTPSSCCRSPRE